MWALKTRPSAKPGGGAAAARPPKTRIDSKTAAKAMSAVFKTGPLR
jgi:hypothetical protein